MRDTMRFVFQRNIARPKSTLVLYLPVKPKIISLTPAEAGHNTVKQREYHPDTSLPALAAPGFYSSSKRAAISKNRRRKLRAYDRQYRSNPDFGAISGLSRG